MQGSTAKAVRAGAQGIGPKGLVLAALLCAAWIGLDAATKALFASVAPGTVTGALPGGLVDFCLVHNTGGAWGVFAGNPQLLGGFSLVVCVALAAYLVVARRSANGLQAAGIALIVAGGVGNAIDRFTQGYVTDFIRVTFIDFPVFNVADIGVTCGVLLLLAGLALAWYGEAKAPQANGPAGDDSNRNGRP